MLLLLYKKQAHLAVGRTLELLECCIDLERTRKVGSSLSTKLVAPKAANRGKTNKTSATRRLCTKTSTLGQTAVHLTEVSVALIVSMSLKCFAPSAMMELAARLQAAHKTSRQRLLPLLHKSKHPIVVENHKRTCDGEEQRT